MSSRDNAAPGASSSTFDTQLPLGSAPPTYAAFSPVTLSANTPSRNSRRSTVLVHQKSPLLLATPPQITRALAYSHPFLLPLNTFVGLLTWSTGDPWQSFLLLSAFWAVVLYGDVVLRWAGPIVLGVGFIAGMYSRRYSSLSSSAFSQPNCATKDATGKKPSRPASDEDATEKHAAHNRAKSESARANAKHQKTLDEIVETLREFTGRCNMLMDPLLEMTDFLSTQRTPTSATTKPALTAMFVRLLIVTPFWIALTMSPWRIITTRRVVFVTGTIMLTWHSRVMRVTRAILWRSAAVRRLAAVITGLSFENPHTKHTAAAREQAVKPHDEERPAKAQATAGPAGLHLSHRRNGSLRGSQAAASVKFTFIIYENQRRWVGLGWTSSLFAYERPAWTDEHHNGVSHKDEFELPGVEDGSRMRWQWAEGSRWRVDGVSDDEDIDQDGPEGRNGWIYYDNKWQNGKRGQDGWGRWTRRRKWYRDAELVEADDVPPATELDATDTVPAPHTESAHVTERAIIDSGINLSTSTSNSTSPSTSTSTSTSISHIHGSGHGQKAHHDIGGAVVKHGMEDEDDTSGLGLEVELELQKQNKEGGQWGIGDEARMSLE
ncbi:Peroxisomal membrane protein PEX30 [Escovopsis weberi]|uniref:Peroxisomal membrane protein PEX30 n=1 Tax=Escovopsis weberi TaxID=150374 RepID=A0A0M8MW63_ESCWE|nr:Peroxisomal membrane protein PEX30 [Escovopsis weberi]